MLKIMFILNYSIWWLTENRFRRQKKAFIMCNRTEPQTIEPWCHAMQSTQQCLYFNLGNAKKNALITNTIILNSKALPFSSKELLFLPLELKMFKDQVVLHALLQGPNNFCDSHSPPPLSHLVTYCSTVWACAQLCIFFIRMWLGTMNRFFHSILHLQAIKLVKQRLSRHEISNCLKPT